MFCNAVIIVECLHCVRAVFYVDPDHWLHCIVVHVWDVGEGGTNEMCGDVMPGLRSDGILHGSLILINAVLCNAIVSRHIFCIRCEFYCLWQRSVVLQCFERMRLCICTAIKRYVIEKGTVVACCFARMLLQTYKRMILNMACFMWIYSIYAYYVKYDVCRCVQRWYRTLLGDRI